MRVRSPLPAPPSAKEFGIPPRDRDTAAHLVIEYETKLLHQLVLDPAAFVAQGAIAQAWRKWPIMTSFVSGTPKWA